MSPSMRQRVRFLHEVLDAGKACHLPVIHITVLNPDGTHCCTTQGTASPEFAAKVKHLAIEAAQTERGIAPEKE